MENISQSCVRVGSQSVDALKFLHHTPLKYLRLVG